MACRISVAMGKCSGLHPGRSGFPAQHVWDEVLCYEQADGETRKPLAAARGICGGNGLCGRTMDGCCRGPFASAFVLSVLRNLCEAQVLLHQAARFGWLASANRFVDLAVQLGRLSQIAGALHSFAALVIEGGTDCLHQRSENGIAGSACDDAVKADVMDQVF